MTRLNRKRQLRVIQGGKRDSSLTLLMWSPWLIWLELMAALISK